jgi:hypothetical protein
LQERDDLVPLRVGMNGWESAASINEDFGALARSIAMDCEGRHESRASLVVDREASDCQHAADAFSQISAARFSGRAVIVGVGG